MENHKVNVNEKLLKGTKAQTRGNRGLRLIPDLTYIIGFFSHLANLSDVVLNPVIKMLKLSLLLLTRHRRRRKHERTHLEKAEDHGGKPSKQHCQVGIYCRTPTFHRRTNKRHSKGSEDGWVECSAYA